MTGTFENFHVKCHPIEAAAHWCDMKGIRIKLPIYTEILNVHAQFKA